MVTTISKKQWRLIKTFMQKWFTNNTCAGSHWKRKKLLKELLDELECYIPEEYFEGKTTRNCFFILDNIINWSSSLRKWHFKDDKDIAYTPLLCDYFGYDYYENTNLSKYAANEFHCVFCMGIDLFVCQSGGVLGYTAQHLLNAFDNDVDTLTELGFDVSQLTKAPNTAIFL